MLFIIIIISFLTALYGLNINKPSCISCVNFIPHKKGIFDLGRCKVFFETFYNDNNRSKIYNFAKHCRENNQLCGKEGYLYESFLEEDSDTNFNEHELFNLISDFNELNNRFSGEINEKYELEQGDDDYSKLLVKIKKYNSSFLKDIDEDFYNLIKDKFNLH
jgi:hypothetical protein